MKPLRKNPAGLLAVMLISVGGLGLGLLGPAGFDLIKEPLEVLRALSAVAVLSILYRSTMTAKTPKPVLVPVRV